MKYSRKLCITCCVYLKKKPPEEGSSLGREAVLRGIVLMPARHTFVNSDSLSVEWLPVVDLHFATTHSANSERVPFDGLAQIALRTTELLDHLCADPISINPGAVGYVIRHDWIQFVLTCFLDLFNTRLQTASIFLCYWWNRGKINHTVPLLRVRTLTHYHTRYRKSTKDMREKLA